MPALAPALSASADTAAVAGPDTADAPRVPAVERAVRLIDALAAAPEPIGLAALARRLELPKSSVHGLLATLVAHGLARRDAAGDFSLGTRPLRWADAYIAQSDILRAFDTEARGIAALSTETTMLAVREDLEVLYLACRPGTRPLAVNFRVGGRFPAACTASGKAMLASLAPEQLRRLFAQRPPVRLTRHGPASVAALARQLAQVRAQGHAVDDEETAEGMQCFGAAVHGPRQAEPVAAVAVSVIKAGLSARRQQALIQAITQLAARLSDTLGASPQPSSATPASSRKA